MADSKVDSTAEPWAVPRVATRVVQMAEKMDLPLAAHWVERSAVWKVDLKAA